MDEVANGRWVFICHKDRATSLADPPSSPVVTARSTVAALLTAAHAEVLIYGTTDVEIKVFGCALRQRLDIVAER